MLKLTEMAHVNRLIAKYNSEKRYFIKMHHAIDMIEVMIKTYVSAVVGVRSKQQPYSEELKKFIISQFKRPSLGHWVGFGRKAALEILVPEKVTKQQFEQTLSIFTGNLKEAYCSWYKEDEKGDYQLHPLQKLQGKSKDAILKILSKIECAFYNKNEKELAFDYYLFERQITELIRFRNEIAHGAVPSEERCEKYIAEYEPKIEALLQQDFFKYSRIIVFNDSGVVKEIEAQSVLLDLVLPTEAYNQIYLLFKEEYINAYPLMLYEEKIDLTEKIDGLLFLNNVLFINDLDDVAKKKQLISTLHYTSGEHVEHAVDLQQFSKVINLEGWKEELKSKQLQFEHIIADATSHFVGRRQELQQLHDFLATKKEGIYYTYALPGNGKTALHSMFYNELEDQGLYRFCYFIRHTEDQQDGPFYTQLLTYIKQSFPVEVQYELKTLEEKRVHIANLFEKISAYLVEKNKKLVWIVDGLNEAPAQLLRLLPTVVYENIYCYYAAQPTAQVERFIRSIHTPFFVKNKLGGLTEEDIYGLLFEVTTKYEIALYASKNRSFIQQLQKKTDGNALYIQHLMQEIRDGRRKVGDLAHVPETLNNYYEYLLYDKLEAKPLVKNAMLLLALAKGPMTAFDLQYALQLHTLNEFKQLLTEFQQFLKVEDGQYALYHDAFRAYILSEHCKAILPEEREIVEDQLLTFCADYTRYMTCKHKPKYPFLYYVNHLKEQEKEMARGPLEALLSDTAYHQIQLELTQSYDDTYELFRQALAFYEEDEIVRYLDYLEQLYEKINESYKQKIQLFEASPTTLAWQLNYIINQTEEQYNWFVVSALYNCTRSRPAIAEQAVQKILSFVKDNNSYVPLKLADYIEPNVYFDLMERLEAKFSEVPMHILYDCYSPIAPLTEDLFEQIEGISHLHFWHEQIEWNEFRINLTIQLLKRHSKQTYYPDIYWVMLKSKALPYRKCLAIIDEEIRQYANASSGIYTIARLQTLADDYELHGKQAAIQQFALLFSTTEDLDYLIEECRSLAPSWSKNFYFFLQRQLNKTLDFDQWAYQLIQQAVKQKNFEDALTLYADYDGLINIDMLCHHETYVKLAQIEYDKEPTQALKSMNVLVKHMLANDVFQADILPTIKQSISSYKENGYSTFRYQLCSLLSQLEAHQLTEEIEEIKQCVHVSYVNLWESMQEFKQYVAQQNKEQLLAFVTQYPLYCVFGGELSEFLKPSLVQIDRDNLKELVDDRQLFYSTYGEGRDIFYKTFEDVAGFLFDEASLIEYCITDYSRIRQQMYILEALLPHYIEVHGMESAKRIIEQVQLTENELRFVIDNIIERLTKPQRMAMYASYPINQLSAIFVSDQLANGIDIRTLSGQWTKEAILYLLENGYKNEALDAAQKWLAGDVSQSDIKKMLHLFATYTSERDVFRLMLEATPLSRKVYTRISEDSADEVERAIKNGIVHAIVKKRIKNEWQVVEKFGDIAQQICYAIVHENVTKLQTIVQMAMFIEWDELSAKEKAYLVENIEHAQLVKRNSSDKWAPVEVMQYALYEKLQNDFTLEELELMLAYLRTCTHPDDRLLDRAVSLHEKLCMHINDRYHYIELVMLQELCEKHNVNVRSPLQQPMLQQVVENGYNDLHYEWMYVDFLNEIGKRKQAQLYAKQLFTYMLRDEDYFSHDVIATFVRLMMHEELLHLVQLNIDFLWEVSAAYMETQQYEALHRLYEQMQQNDNLESEVLRDLKMKHAIDSLYTATLNDTDDAEMLQQVLLAIQDSPNHHEVYINMLVPFIVYKNDWTIVKEIIEFFGYSSICEVIVSSYCSYSKETLYLESILKMIEKLHLPLKSQRALFKGVIEKLGYSYPDDFNILIVTLSFICHDEQLFNYWKIAKNVYAPFK